MIVVSRSVAHSSLGSCWGPRGERLPAQVADHLSDAADVMPAITGVSGCSALDDIELVNIFLGEWVPYRRSIFQMWSH